MKTQYVGVIFTNDIGAYADLKGKTYYFKDNIGSTVGDEVVVRCTSGRLAVVEVVTVSDVAPSEKLLNGKPLCSTLCKVDKSEEDKRNQYLMNKQRREALYTEVIRTTTKNCPLEDVARTLLCAAAGQNTAEIKEAWDKYFETKKLQKEIEAYEEEYGICASTSAK